jgi:DNA-binding transcriptional regulator YiaG
MSAKSPDVVDVQVGQRIRVLRQETKMSRTELADHLGVTFQQVQIRKGLEPSRSRPPYESGGCAGGFRRQAAWLR